MGIKCFVQDYNLCDVTFHPTLFILQLHYISAYFMLCDLDPDSTYCNPWQAYTLGAAIKSA